MANSCYAAKMYSREFTDYRPSCRVDDALCAENKIQNSYHYRLHLQNNAEKIMDANRQRAISQAYCWNCTSKQAKWGNVAPLRRGASRTDYA
jgi:hypothetical protein